MDRLPDPYLVACMAILFAVLIMIQLVRNHNRKDD